MNAHRDLRWQRTADDASCALDPDTAYGIKMRGAKRVLDLLEDAIESIKSAELYACTKPNARLSDGEVEAWHLREVMCLKTLAFAWFMLEDAGESCQAVRNVFTYAKIRPARQHTQTFAPLPDVAPPPAVPGALCGRRSGDD